MIGLGIINFQCVNKVVGSTEILIIYIYFLINIHNCFPSHSVRATLSSEPRFVGAPFELWVGGGAPVGTSVGQVRVEDMPGPEQLFDMFHSYTNGGESLQP